MLKKTNDNYAFTSILLLCHYSFQKINLGKKLLEFGERAPIAWRKKEHGHLYPVIIVKGVDCTLEEISELEPKQCSKLISLLVPIEPIVSVLPTTTEMKQIEIVSDPIIEEKPIDKNHQLILSRLEDVVVTYEHLNLGVIFEPFFTAIEKKEYGKALRTACTAKGHEEVVLSLVKAVYAVKNPYPINHHEKVGEKQLSAMDYARLKANHKIVDYFNEVDRERAALKIQMQYGNWKLRTAFFQQKEAKHNIQLLKEKITVANQQENFTEVSTLAQAAAAQNYCL